MKKERNSLQVTPLLVTKPKHKIKIDTIFPYLLILPTLFLVVTVLFYPIFDVFRLSLQNHSLINIHRNGFVGLENFRKIFTEDKVFYGTIPVTIKWVLVEVSLQLLFGLIVALLLNQVFKGRGLVRAIVFVPWAVSGVLTTMLWMLMFNQHIGLVNDLFIKLGIINESVAWLANPETTFAAVIVAELWRGIPFFAITLLAALQSIPVDIYESCEIDGCGKIKRFFYIVLPYLKESIVLTTLLRAIWEFNNIDLIFTMTNGGPFYLTTTLPLYTMKTAIIDTNFGYGSALAVVMFVILLCFAAFYLKINKYGGEIDE